ncbi:DUF1801 domain-containing protein [Fulvivirga ligni]|uniref:DUF1801 domain-containing protein n=1 Tax=Fulvivirga ligni TaxID=2904246 RepID=UPI001F306473|nr:DUF1801 domain-containing protein [Fulvivirga ligni]UII20157.1 DUF1801 domain-containing protein [Fulvivirga ligni]
MELRQIEEFYLAQPSPNQECMLAIHSLILSVDADIETAWKYKLPFFCYRKKMMCYIWKDKKTQWPYIGVADGKLIDHPLLQVGDRARMAVIPINPYEDLPAEAIKEIVSEAIQIIKRKLKK